MQSSWIILDHFCISSIFSHSLQVMWSFWATFPLPWLRSLVLLRGPPKRSVWPCWWFAFVGLCPVHQALAFLGKTTFGGFGFQIEQKSYFMVSVDSTYSMFVVYVHMIFLYRIEVYQRKQKNPLVVSVAWFQIQYIHINIWKGSHSELII